MVTVITVPGSGLPPGLGQNRPEPYSGDSWASVMKLNCAGLSPSTYRSLGTVGARMRPGLPMTWVYLPVCLNTQSQARPNM